MDDVAECDIVDDQGTSEPDTDKCDIDNECNTEEKEDNVIRFTLATCSADQELALKDQSLMHTKTTGIYSVFKTLLQQLYVYLEVLTDFASHYIFQVDQNNG